MHDPPGSRWAPVPAPSISIKHQHQYAISAQAWVAVAPHPSGGSSLRYATPLRYARPAVADAPGDRTEHEHGQLSMPAYPRGDSGSRTPSGPPSNWSA